MVDLGQGVFRGSVVLGKERVDFNPFVGKIECCIAVRCLPKEGHESLVVVIPIDFLAVTFPVWLWRFKISRTIQVNRW